jgi:DNA-binding NarL/FixJ family response regulator
MLANPRNQMVTNNSSMRETMRESRRVFIVYSHALFAEGVNSLLGKEDGLTVVGMDNNLKRAVERINTIEPEVVVIDGEHTDAELINAMAGVLATRPGTTIINVSLSDNNATVFRTSHVPIKQTEDLIQAIKTK